MYRLRMVAALATLVLAAGCGVGTPEPEAGGEKPDAFALQAMATALFRPLPAEMVREDNPITDAKANLGRMLYYEKRLSQYGDLSCNACHALDKYGVDGRPTSIGFMGQRLPRNAPTTYNAALQLGLYWDGRAASVEAQARLALLDTFEMAIADASALERTLRAIPGYAEAFKAAFPDDENPITLDNMARAIGAFERRLVTPSVFDRFLAGETTALNDQQLAGLRTFLEVGCARCHVGTLIGGSLYEKLGAVKPYPTTDFGRAQFTRLETDKFVFRVPSLRNVAETGPYFHDGKVASLAEAIQLMAEHQLGKKLKDRQVTDIQTFFGSLTGTIPAAYIARPAMP
jgi:cytochrome c peroxidase